MKPDGWGRPGDPRPGLPRAGLGLGEGSRGARRAYRWLESSTGRRSPRALGGSSGACQHSRSGDLSPSLSDQALSSAVIRPRRRKTQMVECVAAGDPGGLAARRCSGHGRWPPAVTAPSLPSRSWRRRSSRQIS